MNSAQQIFSSQDNMSVPKVNQYMAGLHPSDEHSMLTQNTMEASQLYASQPYNSLTRNQPPNHYFQKRNSASDEIQFKNQNEYQMKFNNNAKLQAKMAMMNGYQGINYREYPGNNLSSIHNNTQNNFNSIGSESLIKK